MNKYPIEGIMGIRACLKSQQMGIVEAGKDRNSYLIRDIINQDSRRCSQWFDSCCNDFQTRIKPSVLPTMIVFLLGLVVKIGTP